MKRSLFFLVLTGLLLASCTEKPHPADLAGEAARQYYLYLVRGNYAAFVDGHFRQDSIPASYRSQLIDNAKMFMAQQQEEHQGIKEVKKLQSKADTLHHRAEAFLQLEYGDHTHTEIVVPMVYVKGNWYLE